MQTGDLMKAIAAVIDAKKDAIGLEGVSYPPLNRVPRSPWLMVRQSMTGQSVIAMASMGLQSVRPTIDLVALVVADPKKPAESARLDAIPHPLLDLFDGKVNGGNVNYAFEGLLDGTISRAWSEAVVRRATIPWGESGDCHALIITIDPEFQRKAILP